MIEVPCHDPYDLAPDGTPGPRTWRVTDQYRDQAPVLIGKIKSVESPTVEEVLTKFGEVPLGRMRRIEEE